MIGVRVFAPAKINLTLHVTGRLENGYHLLDSLVAFAGVGDVVEIRKDGRSGALSVTGPEAEGVPTDATNLIFHVAAAFWPPTAPISFTLDKHLPSAAGIGGGSADAAACFRGIAMLRQERGDGEEMVTPEAAAQLLRIGADVPMCVLSDPMRVRGIGEDMTPVPLLPEFPAVLVNPRAAVPTSAVFSALEKRDNAPMEPLPEDMGNAETVLAWLSRQRNDLEPPARARAPLIAQVLADLEATNGCRLARMSGSGATCFALYDTLGDAEAAADGLAFEHPDWWIRATRLDGARRAEPQEMRATT